MPESILKNGEWSYMQTTLQAGDIEGYITEGKLTVSAASVDTMEEFVTAKDTVIVANREDAQIGAIQTGVQCVVVCMGTEVTDKVLELAKEKNCRIITTPYDTFTASRLICQAMPVSYIMATDTIVSFNETDFVDDVKEEMTKKRFRYFPRIVMQITKFVRSLFPTTSYLRIQQETR